MRLCHANWRHAYAILHAQYHPTKYINQHTISMQYACMQHVNANMQCASIQYVNANMQCANMQYAVCQCKLNMQYVNANMPACSMSTYSMQWLNMHACVYQYAVCRRARCQCTALTTCMCTHIGRGTSIYLGGATPTPLHTYMTINYFDLIKKNCTKPLQI